MAATKRKAAADSSPLVGEGVGRVAYEAYCDAVGGKSVRGEALPDWDSQDRNVAAAWCAAAQAVLTATFEGND